MPLFSIITVTYKDYENFVRTYHSLFGQTFDDFDWVVVNGNPYDETDKFIAELDNFNVTLISEKDNGLYDAMNKGIVNAKGDYVIFLNSGDIFSDEKILDVVSKEIKSNDPIDFIFGDSHEYNNNGQKFYRSSRPLYWKYVGMFTHHQTMFYKNQTLITNNITYNLNYSIAADYDFTLNFISNSKNQKYLRISICDFQQGGLSHQSWKKGIREQYYIRNKYYPNIKFLNYFVYLLQVLLHRIRFNVNWLYKLYRFRS